MCNNCCHMYRHCHLQATAEDVPMWIFTDFRCFTVFLCDTVIHAFSYCEVLSKLLELFIIIISLPKVIREEGRVTALSHTYAVKSTLVTMAHPKFAPKSTPSCGPIPKPASSLDASNLWCQTASRSDPPFCHNALDRPTDATTYGSTDRPRESLMTIGRCAMRATWPNICS